MAKIDQYRRQLEPLLEDPAEPRELERFLEKHSGLPGPRGNLQLAEAFVRAVTTAPMPAAWLPTLYRWAAIDAAQAPTGDPREFLPFCAVLSFGALFHTHRCSYPCSVACDCPCWPVQCEYLVEAIRKAAADARWRLREAAAMALQHLGEGDPAALRLILADWLKDCSLAEHRAVLAALAHPPLLTRKSLAHFALRAGDTALKRLHALPAAQRKEEGFRVLAKGASYALSVFTAALPKEGLALLEHWQSSDDPVIRRIVAANLSKKRIQRARERPKARST